MTPLLLAALIFYALIQSLGQVSFKLASNYDKALSSSWVIPFRYFLNPYYIFAVALYAGLTFLWMWVLARIPITKAFPFLFLSFIILPLLAHAFLGEKISWNLILGGAIIILGVAVSFGSGM